MTNSALALLLSAALLASSASAPPSPGPAWLDYAPGLQQARQHGKPVLVQFVTGWCGYCRRMERETFRHPDVVRRLDRAVPVRIDAEDTEVRDGVRGTDLADRYQVRIYPTLVMLDARGELVARADGFLDAPGFLSWYTLSLTKAAQRSVARPAAF